MRNALLSGLSVIVSTAISFWLEPLMPLGDRRWLVVAAMGTAVGIGLWLTDPNHRKQPTISSDGREIAKKIGRMGKRQAAQVDRLYRAYGRLPATHKQFPDRADSGYWRWLNEHDPERAVQFARARHGPACTGWREDAVDLTPEPWQKRLWERIRG